MQARTLALVLAATTFAASLYLLLLHDRDGDLARVDAGGAADAASEVDSVEMPKVVDDTGRIAVEDEERVDRSDDLTPAADDAGDTTAWFEVAVTHADTGAPTPGLDVSLSRIDAENLHGTTGEDGVARFELDARFSIGSLRVHPGRATTQFYEWQLPSVLAGETQRVDVQVDGGWSVVGRCVDEAGDPVAGAIVRGWCESRAYGSHDREVITGSDGWFRVDHLGPKAWVESLHPGRGLVSAKGVSEDEPSDASVEYELVMVPALETSLRVVDGRGIPLAGVMVRATGNNRGQESVRGGGALIDTGLFRLETDANGEVQLPLLSSRTFQIEADLPPFLPYRAYHEITGEPIVIELQEGFGVQGVVYDATGAPAEGALVRLGPSRMGRTMRGGVRTDANGRFRAIGMRPLDELRGQPWMVVLHDGHAVEVVQPVALADGGEGEPMDVHLVAGASITGRVLVDGRPVDQAEVWVSSERMLEGDLFERPNVWEVVGGGGDVYTTPDGRFELTHLFPDETYTVHVQPTMVRPQVFEFEVEAGARDRDLEISGDAMRGVVLVGRVTDRVTGEPIPSFSVAPNGGFEVEGKDGDYVYEGLPEGRVDMYFLAPGYLETALEPQSFELGENRVDVSLVPAASLDVTVVGPEGEPVGRAGELSIVAAAGYEELFDGLGFNQLSNRRTGELVQFDPVPACPVEVRVKVPGDLVATTVDLTGGGHHEVEIVTSGRVTHVHRVRVLTASPELAADEVVRRLRSNEAEDVAWIAARFEEGSLGEPVGDLSLDLRLFVEGAGWFMSRGRVWMVGERWRLRFDNGESVDLDAAEFDLPLAEGDWDLRVDLRDPRTLDRFPYTHVTDLSDDGSQLSVVLMVGPGE